MQKRSEGLLQLTIWKRRVKRQMQKGADGNRKRAMAKLQATFFNSFDLNHIKAPAT